MEQIIRQSERQTLADKSVFYLTLTERKIASFSQQNIGNFWGRFNSEHLSNQIHNKTGNWTRTQWQKILKMDKGSFFPHEKRFITSQTISFRENKIISIETD